MFAKDLDDRPTVHGQLSGPPSQQWEQFKTMVTESAKLTIGPKKKVHQDWFNENDERIKELLDGKKKAFIEWQNEISSTSLHSTYVSRFQSLGSLRLWCLNYVPFLY